MIGDAGQRQVVTTGVPSPPDGTVVPPNLAGLTERLIGYGLDVLSSRNGHLPPIPGMDELRASLRSAAASASGRPRRTIVTLARGRDLTAVEAAVVMRLTPRHVRRLAAEGKVVARKQGRDWGIDRDAAYGYRGRTAA